jgi:hypothetical protein
MDAALENVANGTDVFVIGPFTKETEQPEWIEEELSTIGDAAQEVEVKVIVVHLGAPEVYRDRIERRDTVLDRWKLEHWSEFSRSLTMRVPKWKLTEGDVLYFDNTSQLDERQLAVAEAFVYGES